MRLAELTRQAAADAAAAGAIAVLPVGSVEQHGQHLPVGTDSLLVAAVANGLETSRSESVLLMPVQWYGASAHHLAFPGTASLSSEMFARLTAEILASYASSTGQRRFLILNGHGGNEAPMRIALEGFRASVPDGIAWACSYWSPMLEAMKEDGMSGSPVIGHADEIETSLMLAVLEDAVAGPGTADVASISPYPWLHTSLGFDRATRGGGVGIPAGATAQRGRRMLELAVERLAVLVDELAGSGRGF
jgi:creatinine amidohydrolase